jgi:hypothetical protein
MWLFLLIISRLLTFNPNAAFLDSAEYVQLANSPWPVALGEGHRPIHPGYVALLKLIPLPAGLISALAGIGTVIVFYLLAKEKIAALIFALLPGVWIVQENVMIESVSLWWLVLATYLAAKKRWWWTGVSLTLMLLTHNQMLVWIPLMFGFTRVRIKTIIAAIGAAAIVYAALGQDLVGLVYTKTGEIVPLWSGIRNAIVLWLRLHSNLVGLVGLVALWKIRNWRWLLLPYLFWAQFYSADFLIRRLIPVTLITSAAIARKVKNKVLLWAVITTAAISSIPVASSYSWLNKNQIINKMHQLQAQIPTNALYIDSHFLRTINNFAGETYHLGESSNQLTPLQAIEVALGQGKRVFIDSQAIVDPYQFYVGNQLHVLSLGKFGHSPAQEIFKQFFIKDILVVDAPKRIFAYELSDQPTDRGQEVPGSTILVYSNNRLLKQRLDYYDPLTWLWAWVTNRREATWVYADKNGKVVF